MFIISSNLKHSDTIFKEKYILISNYTLHLKGAGIDSRNINTEFNDLLRHFTLVLDIESKNEGYFKIKELKDNTNITKNNYLDASTKVDNYWIEKNIVYDINYSYINTEKLQDIKKLNKLKVEKKRLGNKILNEKDLKKE